MFTCNLIHPQLPYNGNDKISYEEKIILEDIKNMSC